MYFVYITRNKINNKMYVGITNGNDKDYLGSGIRLKNAVKKYGKENFENSILEECESIELLEQRERFWISFFDSVNKGRSEEQRLNSSHRSLSRMPSSA